MEESTMDSQRQSTSTRTTTYFMECLCNKDWETTIEFLTKMPHLAKQQVRKGAFAILWNEAPIDVIRHLLRAWPSASMRVCQEDYNDMDLIEVKVKKKEWETIKMIVHEFPNAVEKKHVNRCFWDEVPFDIFEQMLNIRPNAILKDPHLIFHIIQGNRLDYFQAILNRCPAMAKIKHQSYGLTPLLELFEWDSTMNVGWISAVLNVHPDSAKDIDFDGKLPLHLAYQHGASAEVIDMLQKAYPEASQVRDCLGRIPIELAPDQQQQQQKETFIPAREVLILGKDSMSIPDDDDGVVVCRRNVLANDLSLEQKEEKGMGYFYAEQVLARHRIFETVLEEFSKIVGFDDNDVIQKAAAVQALASKYLSKKDDTIIDFRSFNNSGYWYRQEILKLAMRIYSATVKNRGSFSKYDARDCLEILEDIDKGNSPPKVGRYHRRKVFGELIEWLTEGISSDMYVFQGPVFKSLQSLFHELFFCRGRTKNVHVLEDMVQGTLFVHDKETLEKILQRITAFLPNIMISEFKHPDEFDKLGDFLCHVHDNLSYIPATTKILPYQFKPNNHSQKEENYDNNEDVDPSWYNFNFFHEVPEYHRVGQSEMFVTYQLQIGLTTKMEEHRKTTSRIAYERDVILYNQPLLKNFLSLLLHEDGKEKEISDDKVNNQEKDKETSSEQVMDGASSLNNCTNGEDITLIDNVLTGKIASEVFVPTWEPHREGDGERQGTRIVFEDNRDPPFGNDEERSRVTLEAFPTRLCINNRTLNHFVRNGPRDFHNNRDDGVFAQVVAGPYRLDATKRYFVETLIFDVSTPYQDIGLYAHVGGGGGGGGERSTDDNNYLIQVVCCETQWKKKGVVVVVVENGWNYESLEQVCTLPEGTTTIEIIYFGLTRQGYGYKNTKIVLNEYTATMKKNKGS